MERVERRDDHLLIELGEILRLSVDSATTLVAVAAALKTHFTLVKCGFAEIVRGAATIGRFDVAFQSDELALLLAGRYVIQPDTEHYTAINIRSYVIVPLMRDRVCVAILFAGAAEARDWGSPDYALVGEVAERSWLWVERDRLVGELQAATRTLELRVEERTRDLNRSLAEKTILLREIHHRVKNNLQVVSSLLSLQRARTPDIAARGILEDAQTRVRSMALVHEQLYRSKDLASVAFAVYVRELVGQLWDSLGARDRGIEAKVDVQDVALPIDIAIPCGLILNELVTNALKHAFPRGKHGSVWISLSRRETKNTLIVRDDGIGIPEGITFHNATTFGMDMALTFVEQLDGAIELVRDEGTTVIVTFNS